MPVAIEMDFHGATLEQYDRVMELMGLTTGAPAPDGALFHWVAKTDDGFRVVDVWETRDQFDRFAADQIGPFSAQAGVPSPPNVTYREVHNHLGG
jgi:hypothetical protein